MLLQSINIGISTTLYIVLTVAGLISGHTLASSFICY